MEPQTNGIKTLMQPQEFSYSSSSTFATSACFYFMTDHDKKLQETLATLQSPAYALLLDSTKTMNKQIARRIDGEKHEHEKRVWHAIEREKQQVDDETDFGKNFNDTTWSQNELQLHRIDLRWCWLRNWIGYDGLWRSSSSGGIESVIIDHRTKVPRADDPLRVREDHPLHFCGRMDGRFAGYS
ncbi:unnamed protein product [Heligmosomoides polygyrus]|uniref:DUF3523 domain-containing protein n=1 Tax=Heligmosomoides polygyrus TaxID=6339 RepID=A0A183FNM4_HELPZ|nr:unnamed protein product [Heligmosomoides polygyrus]